VTVLPEVRHYGEITTVCLSTKVDERYVVCGSADCTLSVFDRELNHRQSLLVGHEDKVRTHLRYCLWGGLPCSQLFLRVPISLVSLLQKSLDLLPAVKTMITMRQRELTEVIN